jgi:hypothetical protein
LNSVIHIGTLIFEGLFGVFAAYAAYSLFSWTPPAVAKSREAMNLPRWFWLLAGTVATLGAIGLFVGFVVPSVAGLAAVWMTCYFLVAIGLHVVKHSLGDIAPAIVFLALSVGLTALRWGDLAPVLHAL